MIARRIIVAAVAITLAAVVLAGCAGTRQPVDSTPAGQGSTVASVSAAASGPSQVPSSAASSSSSSATAGAVAGLSSSSSAKGVSGEDLAAIKKQLEAMQREIDSLKMPTDNDFSGAEGAVY